MTNAELATYLNAELSLAGAVAVTPDVIRQWVLWDVLPKAVGRGLGRGRGVNWQRSERDLERARQLATWRAAGVRRENALIVHAYVEWGYPDWERVREALASELALATAAVRKRITTDLQFDTFNGLSQTRKRAFRTQFGPLDQRLKGTPFELSSELYALAGQAVFQPDSSQASLLEILPAFIFGLFPSSTQFSSEVAHSFVAATIGLFASEDETTEAMLSALRQCSNREIRTARLLLRRVYKTLEFEGFSTQIPPRLNLLFELLTDLKQSITVGHWLIAGLASTVRLAQAGSTELAMLRVNPELFSEKKSNLL